MNQYGEGSMGELDTFVVVVIIIMIVLMIALVLSL